MMRRIFFNVEMKNRKKYQSLRGFPVSAYEVPGFSILRAITTKDTKDHEGNAISDVPSWTGACPERTRRMSFVVIALYMLKPGTLANSDTLFCSSFLR